MAGFPSDFDLVSLEGEGEEVGQVLEALIRHKLVKSVTQQKMITRFLKTVPEDELEEGLEEEDLEIYEDEEEEEETEAHSWTKGRRSLSLGAAFWRGEERRQGRKLLRSVPRQITGVLQADVLWEMGITGAGVKVCLPRPSLVNKLCLLIG